MRIDYKNAVSIILSIALIISILVLAGVFEKSEIILSSASSEQEVKVYIVGEIKEPGIYSVKKGSILNELVEKAGGLKDSVDKEMINLAFPIDKNMMIKVLDSSVAKADDDEGVNIYDEKLSSLMVNINTASLEELVMIPGVGEATAEAIISFREQNGRYEKIEDIMKVVGIKQAKFELMRDFICVN
jgi:competence protein ComEA